LFKLVLADTTYQIKPQTTYEELVLLVLAFQAGRKERKRGGRERER
jgi:hypothetical protein